MPRTLGDFEQLLLFAILRLGDEAYGVRIRQEIEDRTGRGISVGAVYTGLERLQARRLISSTEGGATAERGGRRKRFYHLEPEGAAELHESYRTFTRMADGVVDDLEALAARAANLGEPG